MSLGSRFLRLAVLGLGSILFTAGVAPGQPAKPSWTILIYGHGDHNLSPALVIDFLEMQKVGSSADFRIVLQTDFDQSEDNTYRSGLPPRFGKGMTRWLVSPSLSTEIVSQVLERRPEINSDRATRLTAFIEWGARKFPADRYGLILWDHGGSWLGFGADQQDGTIKKPRKIMSLNAIGGGLRKGLARSGIRLDFLSFDACLMMNQEVFTEVSPYADMLITNAEIDYGNGWDYTGSLGWLKENPAANMAMFSQADAAVYAAHHDSPIDRFFMAHTALRTDRADEFNAAAAAFAAQLRRHFTERVARAQRNAPSYYVGGFAPGTAGALSSAFVDLPRMAQILSRDRQIPRTVRTSARRFFDLFVQMRTAVVLGKQKRLAGGMNVFLPLTSISARLSRKFNNLNADRAIHWSRVINAGLIAARNRSEVPQFETPAPIVATAGNPVDLTVSVLSGRPYAIHVDIQSADGRYSLGEAGRIVVDGKRREYPLVWDARVVQVSTAAGYQTLPTYQQQETSVYIAPVRFTDRDLPEPLDGTIAVEVVGKKVRILEAIAAPSTVAPRGFEASAGTVITPLLKTEGDPLLASWSFVVPRGGISKIDARVLPLSAGNYRLNVRGDDAFGHEGATVVQSVQLR